MNNKNSVALRAFSVVLCVKKELTQSDTEETQSYTEISSISSNN